MRIPTLLLVSALLAAPGAASAQRVAPYGPVEGTRVRVSAPALSDQPLVGRVVAFSGDSLVLGASSGQVRTRIPLAQLQRVEASDGHARFMSALRYGLVGMLAGAVIGGASLRDESQPLAGVVGFFAGGVIGAPIGAATGAILAPERWHTVWRAEDAP